MSLGHSPEEIVQKGGRQLVSGKYDSLMAQILKSEKLVALVQAATRKYVVSLNGQKAIESIVENNGHIIGFFAVPENYNPA